jgi:hypothetical protein
MAAQFPDHPMLRGVFAPMFVEGESGELGFCLFAQNSLAFCAFSIAAA